MKARIVILSTGQVSIFVDEGTLETGAKAIEQLFDELEVQGVKFDSVSAVEQHRHDEQKVEEHSHVNQ
jgi:MFS superfamily sulfate permease-like transporter